LQEHDCDRAAPVVRVLEADSARDTLADDLLVGAEPIAQFTGLKQRAIYHAAATGHLPIFKIGSLLAARKSELRAALSAARKNGAAR
jgi:hypothetical protein